MLKTKLAIIGGSLILITFGLVIWANSSISNLSQKINKTQVLGTETTPSAKPAR